MTAKKGTKKRDARAKLLFCEGPYANVGAKAKKMEVNSSCLLSSQLSRRSRAKTLAMRAIIALIAWPLKITKMAEIRFLD